MSGLEPGFAAHVEGGNTTICRCWAVVRRDGWTMGFTDHDMNLNFEGIDFRADTGLTAAALQQTTGLSVDNTEALGALSDAAITDEDIEAGRFDGAEVRAWLVNWADVSLRALMFRGHIGEVTRREGAFEAELRGLTDILNQPSGRVYQKNGNAVLDPEDPAFGLEVVIHEVQNRQVFRFEGLEAYRDQWFQFGTLTVLDGAAMDLEGSIKRDYFEDDIRVIELWRPIRASLTAGDRVHLLAGCDNTIEAHQEKFASLLDFQGFPDLPGDDWSFSDPTRAQILDGGSRRG
ncbi:MAG: DUF2163 domain-containing protein [Pseudomonadota bacterium]